MTALFAYRSIDDDDHHRDDAGGSSSSSTSSIDGARNNRSVACSTITDALLHRPRKPTANGSSKIPGTPTTVRCYSEEEEEEYSHSYNLREDFLVPNIDDSPSPMARGAILRPVFRDPFPGVDADANANTNANTAHASNPTIRLHRTAAPLLSVFATRARASVLTGSKEDSVNRTDDDDDNAWIRYNNGNTINNTIDNNTNDDDTSKTICTNYYAKQRSRKQIRKLYGTTSSTNSNSKNDTEGGRSSSLHRKLSMTRVKDAWNTLVADRSSQSSTPASSQSGNGRRSFLPSCRSTMFYHYLRDEAETKTKTKSKTKSDRPRTRQHVSVEPPSMPSLSSPTDGKNQNYHHNANHHHTADAVPPSAATTTTTTTTNSKTRWNQLVHGFRKEPSLSSPSAAALLSSSASASASTSATTAAPSNSNSSNISDCCHQSTTLDLSTASAHTTCAETTDSGTCITAPGSLPSSPRLVALIQKGLYRCRNDEDDDEDDDDDEGDEEEGEDEGCEDNDHPAAGSFDFAIGRGEF